MKTKHYELTEIEVLAIREALDMLWFDRMKDMKPNSPLIINMKSITKPLLEQFKQDYALMV